MRHAASLRPFAAALALAGALVSSARADDGQRLLAIDHYVPVKSIVPAIKGETVQIYVHERALASTMARNGGADRVVLFIHGAGTPAEVAFDVPYQDYSWMGFLARAGYDVFSMDTEGYGRSSRPSAMNDPCNLPADQQAGIAPAHCEPSYPYQLTTLESDWNDVGAAIDYLRALRHVDRVSLVAWSLGGPRSAGFAAQHPEKVANLILLAPAYNRSASATPPGPIPFKGAAMNKQTRADFDANWDRQVGCPNQYESAVAQSVWRNMLASDPVGATWGPGVRRAPNTTSWGWTTDVVKKTMIPTLMISGRHDKQVDPQRVRDMYADLGAQSKVFVDLACSSHNAMWEKNHMLLFQASLEWLQKGTVNGNRTGMLRLGYSE